jgi:hypothetical protein
VGCCDAESAAVRGGGGIDGQDGLDDRVDGELDRDGVVIEADGGAMYPGGEAGGVGF